MQLERILLRLSNDPMHERFPSLPCGRSLMVI